MKAIITCKQNCITVTVKKESETLYDIDLKEMINTSDTIEEFTDKVFDYFSDEMDSPEINYKELTQICKKVYNNLK